MKAIELNEIDTKQTVLGATCPKCGGDLVRSNIRYSKATVLKVATMGMIDIQTLVCSTCHKKFNLF